MIPIRIYRYIVSTFVYFDNSRKEILLLKLKRKILVNLVMSCVTLGDCDSRILASDSAS